MARLLDAFSPEQVRRFVYVYRETGSLREVPGDANKLAIKRAFNYKLI